MTNKTKIETLSEKLLSRGNTLIRKGEDIIIVCENIKKLRKLDDATIRRGLNNEDGKTLDYINLTGPMDTFGDIGRYPMDDAPASNQFYERSMTKEVFERGLKNTIFQIKSGKGYSFHKESLPFLESVLAEHMATPYKEQLKGGNK